MILKERIEAQERKITNLELSRQLASGGGSSKKSDADTIIKKLTDAEEKEKECQKVMDYFIVFKCTKRFCKFILNSN